MVRTGFRSDGITGTLYNDQEEPIAVTLEHSYDGEAKLPAGPYTCKRGMHTLHHHPVAFETFEVMDVPGHTGILFHVANWQRDLDGCIGLGRTVIQSEVGTMITDSNFTFTKFMYDLDGIDTFLFTVEDGVTV